jgi:hypothetical protein
MGNEESGGAGTRTRAHSRLASASVAGKSRSGTRLSRRSGAYGARTGEGT